MKIIDAHNHPDWHGHDLNQFLRNMDQYGIEKTWLLTWECPEREYDAAAKRYFSAGLTGTSGVPVPFSRCISYLERAPERFVLGYAPDPRVPGACDALTAAHEIYGAKLCGEFKFRMMYDDPDALALFHAAGSLKMPVTLHMQYDLRADWKAPRQEWFGGTIDTLERVLQACPDTIFLGHAPGFWIHLSKDDFYRNSHYPEDHAPVFPGGRLVELLRNYPNLYCDISAGSGRMALQRDSAFAVKFLTEFQDRVLYARDFFDNLHQEFLNSLGLPETILRKIYALNAERLLGK